MTPDQRKKYLEGAITQLQGELKVLEERANKRGRALGFIGEKLQKVVWAPEVSNMIPQLFSWTSEGDPLIEEIAESLFLKDPKVSAEIPLTSGTVVLTYSGARLWISAENSNALLGAVANWSLDVQDVSHPFEKIQQLQEKVDSLDFYLVQLFPIREVSETNIKP